MNKSISILYALLILSCTAQTNALPSEKKDRDFILTYTYAALGSGMGTRQPVFTIKDNAFSYTLEQNSHYGEQTLTPKMICSGVIRQSSIDSIIQLVESVEDTLIYQVDPGIISGGVHNISIDFKDKSLTFKLHNASDPLAEKIVAILNSNIPDNEIKLWLFGFLEEG